jgi:hypothetical protein
MVSFSDFTLKDLKNIAKEYNLHHKIKFTGLKKNELVGHIENYLYIEGDRIKELSDKEYKIPKKKERADRTYLNELRKVYLKIKRKYDNPKLSNEEANLLVPDLDRAFKAIKDEEKKIKNL